MICYSARCAMPADAWLHNIQLYVWVARRAAKLQDAYWARNGKKDDAGNGAPPALSNDKQRLVFTHDWLKQIC